MLRPAGAYDRSLRAVMWWDAFLSLEVALLAIVALPFVMLAGLPRSSVLGVGLAAILAAIVLAACGVVTAILIGLRMRLGDDLLPANLWLPLPGWMRPTLRGGGFESPKHFVQGAPPRQRGTSTAELDKRGGEGRG